MQFTVTCALKCTRLAGVPFTSKTFWKNFSHLLTGESLSSSRQHWPWQHETEQLDTLQQRGAFCDKHIKHKAQFVYRFVSHVIQSGALRMLAGSVLAFLQDRGALHMASLGYSSAKVTRHNS